VLREQVLHRGCKCLHGRGTFGVSGQLKSIVKDFGGWVKGAKTGGPILTTYASYDMRKEMPFGGHDDCICVKMFSGVNFINRNYFLNALISALIQQLYALHIYRSGAYHGLCKR